MAVLDDTQEQTRRGQHRRQQDELNLIIDCVSIQDHTSCIA